MDSSLISAIAALIGASIGGLTSVLASWLLHQRQVRVQWVAQEVDRRRELYKEFIEDASKCYVDALQHDTGDIPTLVALHATIGRMRILSSSTVIASAEKVRRKILDTYVEPDKSFPELPRSCQNQRRFVRSSPRVWQGLPRGIRRSAHNCAIGDGAGRRRGQSALSPP